MCARLGGVESKNSVAVGGGGGLMHCAEVSGPWKLPRANVLEAAD